MIRFFSLLLSPSFAQVELIGLLANSSTYDEISLFSKICLGNIGNLKKLLFLVSSKGKVNTSVLLSPVIIMSLYCTR